MFTQQTISCLIAALVVVILLVGASISMAGAYDTGEGHGYASCASAEFMPNGTIFRIVRIQPNVRPTFYGEIGQLQWAVLLRRIFGPAAYCLQGRKI